MVPTPPAGAQHACVLGEREARRISYQGLRAAPGAGDAEHPGGRIESNDWPAQPRGWC